MTFNELVPQNVCRRLQRMDQKWKNIKNEKISRVCHFLPLDGIAPPSPNSIYIFFIVCVRDLCHPSLGACWGRFSGRGCRVQVEESRTQDGN